MHCKVIRAPPSHTLGIEMGKPKANKKSIFATKWTGETRKLIDLQIGHLDPKNGCTRILKYEQ